MKIKIHVQYQSSCVIAKATTLVTFTKIIIFFKTVYEAISRKTPVVVVGGSGGWADILAALYDKRIENVSEQTIVDLMKGRQ